MMTVSYMIALGLLFVLFITKSWKSSYTTALFVIGLSIASFVNYFHIGVTCMNEYILEFFAGISLMRAIIIKRIDNLKGHHNRKTSCYKTL